jgi:hypothetical protein
MSKLETNSNDRIVNDQNMEPIFRGAFVLNFGYSDFDIVSDFGFRYFNLINTFSINLELN